MPLFNKLLHSKIRNKFGIKISQTLKNKSVSAKEIKYKKYIPLKYDCEEKEEFICQIENGRVFADWGFIFTGDGFYIKDVLPLNIIDSPQELFGRFIFYKFRKRRKIKGNIFVLKSQWHVYYGHWIHEILSRIFLLKDSKLFDEIDTIILSKHCKAKFYLEGLKLFGLDKKKIILVEDEEEIICDNLYFSSFPGISVANPPKWVCDKYLNLTKELLSKNNFHFYDKIYISRKRVKTRNILNEDELINILSPLGYKVIYPEDYSLEEQFCIFNKAKKIISVLGSGLTNLVCCDKETSVLGIVSYASYEDCHRNICKTIGMKYFEYIENNPDNIVYFNKIIKDRNKNNFKIDLDLFKEKLKDFENSKSN